MDSDAGRTTGIPIVPAAPLTHEQPGEAGLAGITGEPQTGERRGFADLASLFAFLEQQTGADARTEDRLPSTDL